MHASRPLPFRLRSVCLVPALIALLPSLGWAHGGEIEPPIPDWVTRMIIAAPAILLAVGIRQWSMAWVAWNLGDRGPEVRRRLSLDPFDHLDPLGTLLMLVCAAGDLPVIGWGKPVPFDPGVFPEPRRDRVRLALAGTLMSLTVAALALAMLHTIFLLGIDRALPDDAWRNATQIFSQLLMVNFSMAVFGMIPLPPLDGASFVESLASRTGSRQPVLARIMAACALYGLSRSGLLSGTRALMYHWSVTMLDSLPLAMAFLLFAGASFWRLARFR